MRKFTLVAFALASTVLASLPAHASQADRKSDEASSVPAVLSPFSGEFVSRGETADKEKDVAAAPSPFSGRFVSGGEVTVNGASS